MNEKISQLNNYTTPQTNDPLPIVDTSTSTTKKITFGTIISSIISSISSVFVPITRTVNGHALSSDIAVTAGDVGAPSGSGSSTGTNTGDQTSVSGNSGSTNALNSSTTTINVSSASAPTNGQVLTAVNGSTATWQTPTTGTVTSVSVATANGVSGTSSGGTTPALTIALGAITPSSVNSVTISGSSTPTLSVTGTTSVSGTNTGDQTSVSGNAGTATKLANARTIAGTSFDGSANVTLANKFIVQGTTDTGLTGAQFLGALGTGIVKNTTSTGVLSIAIASDFPTLNQDTTGKSAKTDALNSASTVVNVSSATAPTTGQVLTATDSTHATWQTPSTGSGTVTAVSVATANGFAGTVATSTTTPAITISTGITGIIKGNGTAISAATSGTDYAPGTSSLATGILKSTTSTGVLSIASNGTDYLSSSTGIKQDQTSGQTIGATGARLTKLWAVDITVTNAIVGSITGNAATVTTNANLTGAITSSGNATSLGSFTSSALATALTDETGTGKAVFGTKPTFVGTIQTVTSMAAQALDGATANIFTRTLAASETFTQSNFSTGQCFMVEVKQGSGTTYTVTWFSGITWVTSGGTAPIQTTVSGGTTTYGFRCTGSNTFLGYLIGTN